MAIVDFGQGLHSNEWDEVIRRTHIGQAHLAGTGPEGATCRTCKFFGKIDRWGKLQSPGFYSARAALNPGGLKQGRCSYRIPGKATRLFPHTAGACRFYEPADNPWPEVKPLVPKKGKANEPD